MKQVLPEVGQVSVPVVKVELQGWRGVVECGNCGVFRKTRMVRTRRQFDGKFKSKVAVEAILGLRTIREISKQYQVHPNQVTLWKIQFPEGCRGNF